MQMIIHAIQTVISMVVMYWYFDNPYLGDHLPAITILLLLGMEGMIFGKSIAVRVRNAIHVNTVLSQGSWSARSAKTSCSPRSSDPAATS